MIIKINSSNEKAETLISFLKKDKVEISICSDEYMAVCKSIIKEKIDEINKEKEIIYCEEVVERLSNELVESFEASRIFDELSNVATLIVQRYKNESKYICDYCGYDLRDLLSVAANVEAKFNEETQMFEMLIKEEDLYPSCPNCGEFIASQPKIINKETIKIDARILELKKELENLDIREAKYTEIQNIINELEKLKTTV